MPRHTESDPPTDLPQTQGALQPQHTTLQSQHADDRPQVSNTDSQDDPNNAYATPTLSTSEHRKRHTNLIPQRKKAHTLLSAGVLLTPSPEDFTAPTRRNPSNGVTTADDDELLRHCGATNRPPVSTTLQHGDNNDDTSPPHLSERIYSESLRQSMLTHTIAVPSPLSIVLNTGTIRTLTVVPPPDTIISPPLINRKRTVIPN